MARPPATPTAARAANERLPVSRMLPDRELLALAGVAFCRERELVPIAIDGDAVIVATACPENGDALAELRARLGRPLVVHLATSNEIAIAIAAAEGDVTDSHRRRALADVLQALRLLREGHASAYALAAIDEPLLGAELVATGLLSEEERGEAVALAFWLPSLSLAAHAATPDLEALLPAGFAAARRALPLWLVRGVLFVGCDAPPDAALVAALHAATGFAIQPVLIDAGELSAALAALPPVEADGVVDAAPALGTLLGESGLAAVQRVAAQTGEPLDAVARRLHGTTAAEIAAAHARAGGVTSYEARRHGTARAILPRALCERLRAVPVGGGDRVVVAMANPGDGRARRALAAAVDAEVQLLFATPDALDALIEELPSAAAAATAAVRGRAVLVDAPEAMIELLRDAGFLSTSARAALEHQRGHAPARLDMLWRGLTPEARADALALATGAPRLRRLLLHPEPQARAFATVLEPAAPGGEPRPLPLLQQGALLTMVASDRDGAADVSGVATEHAMHAAIAWTSAAELARAHAELDGLDLAALSPWHVALARVLEQRHGLQRAQALALLRRAQRESEPLDVACAELHLLRPDALATAFGTVLGARSAQLSRADGASHAARAGGELEAATDPVDARCAQLLTIAESERLGALPFARVAGELVLALADPLDAPGRAELRRLLGEDFAIRPATRSAIREASLRAHGQPALGDLLLDAGLVTRDQIDRALALAERSGVRLGQALVSQRAISADELAQHIAGQQGLPFVAIRGMDLDRAVAMLLPEEFARKHGMLPIAIGDAGRVTLAVEDPTHAVAIAEATQLIARPVTIAVTTRDDVRDGLERLYHEQYLQHSAEDLLLRFPGDSAHEVLSRGQRWFLSLGTLGLVAALVLWTVPVLTALLAASTAFYLAFSGYKFYLIYRALSHTLEVPVTAEAVTALRDRDLPVYTLLIPLYRESAVLPLLVRGLSRLDYPKEKLDVKLLLEEDDIETIAAARAAGLPPYFDITIVPDGRPKGKPKACNYGLLHARGEYIVIFDAEDIPEADQLKKVLVAFAISAPEVVCIQTKLNYYNRNQNVLTKWFTTEYSTWFDLFLPGLDASGAPIPLGGTSNHFKTEGLRAAGAWDPFNVTEDADLGLRIFKLGGRTAVVDSTTFEEANSVLDNWFRQRSRWVKGYIQTYLVHMRHPWLLMRQLGFGGFVSFQLVIGGTFFGFLLNPVLWGLTAVWFLTHWAVIQEVFPAPVYYMGAVSLYAGNFAFAYMNVAGCLRRRYYSLVKWALLSPVYWVLMSVAAWKGFLQLFYRPFYWEKTIHGLTDVSRIDELAELSAEPR